jgi:glycosyltransferase involved in cell wall biosynthesis
MKEKIRVALLTNLISPYRVPVYQGLADAFKLAIFHGEFEANRPEWSQTQQHLGGAFVKQSWGIKISRNMRRARSTGIYEQRFVHINPGYFFDLIRFHPDAIVTNEMGFRTIMALLYSMLWRKPVWVGTEATRHSERNRKGIRTLIRFVLAHWVRHWISFSKAATDYLADLGVTRERILQVQDCVDEELFQHECPKLIAQEPKPVLLYVGRFVELKGIDLFLRAAAELQREGKVFSVLLVGGGPEQKSLEALVMELQLKNVRFIPPQAPEAMPAVYRSADCLVFPTLDDVWGMVVNEALWSGVPVICSIYAGCAKELLSEECLFDPTDTMQFVAILRDAVGARLPAGTKRLWTIHEVTDTIVQDVERHARGSHVTRRS